MISNTRYWFLLILVVLVYVAGMFVTLFENDSAQFAVMAMRMVQEQDFLNLFKGPEEYLDKPHLHYWLAAFSYSIFGIQDWAYRIPGILATFLGAYSCFGLGRLLYSKDAGKLAALIFMTAQTIVLSVIDVRTDAVLTGFTIFAIWQLATYIETRKLLPLVLGAFGAAMAFSTKGQIALLVTGFPILCHLAYTRKWSALVNWRILVALLVFFLCISPMLYAYYHQFDMHPEKVIRGKDHRSGIFFIFWEQSFERMSGDGMGKNSSDYFFFFHTFLWVFLPWTVLGIMAYWVKLKGILASRFRYVAHMEFLTIGGIALIFITISFAQFKLPHYLNITIPLFSVLTGAYLCETIRAHKRRIVRILLGIQYFILALVFFSGVLLCFFVFELNGIWPTIVLLALVAILIYFCLKREHYYYRIITISVCSSLLLNAVLNLHFYPSLLDYQGGSTMSRVIKEQRIPVDKIYKISPMYTWSLDFYNQNPVNITDLEGLKAKKDVWVYVTEADFDALKSRDFEWDRQYVVDNFRITRLQAKFMDPKKRDAILDHMYLLHIKSH
tara:strand:+ start:5522 stop:7186 length:1665 start_codon:yes stop_codon:yes gene_type:complete